MSADVAVSITGLRKRYGDVEALKGIDLEVRRGEVLGFLGPNGAGKTTLIEILEGYRSRSAGEVQVLGVDPAKPTRRWRARIGLVLQECELDPVLTVSETLKLFASFYDRPRPLAEVIRLVGLQGKEGARLGRLSGGQRRRADVAVALVGDPDLIFLDEPTTGFDPTARRETWNTINGLKQLGKTILLTTHYMDEAQHLADRVAIIRSGEIVAQGPPDEIVGASQGRAIVSFRTPAEALDGLAAALEARLERSGAQTSFEAADPQRALLVLTTWADRENVRLDGLEVRRPSLEDAFLELTSSDAQAGDDGR